MVDLNDLIHVHPNFLDDEVCEFLINLYDDNLDYHLRVENNKLPNFTQLNLTEVHQSDKTLENIHNFIVQRVIEYRDQYYEYIDARAFPSSHAFEQLVIKKYNNDGVDQYDTHVDVMDQETSKRYLAFTIYLNDVIDGGNTIFRDYKVSPRRGSLLIFPPLWMYPYKEEPPISGPKYLLTTYLHYT